MYSSRGIIKWQRDCERCCWVILFEIDLTKVTQYILFSSSLYFYNHTHCCCTAMRGGWSHMNTQDQVARWSPNAHFTAVFCNRPGQHSILCLRRSACTHKHTLCTYVSLLHGLQQISLGFLHEKYRAPPWKVPCTSRWFSTEWKEPLLLTVNQVSCVHTHHGAR